MKDFKAKITGKNAFVIQRALKKMGIISDIKDIFTKQSKLENQKKEVLRKVIKKSENKDENIEDILDRNQDLKKEFYEIQDNAMDSGMDLIELVLSNIDCAEKEIFNAVSKVYSVSVKDLEEEDFSVFAKRIEGILKSESFLALFSSLKK